MRLANAARRILDRDKAHRNRTWCHTWQGVHIPGCDGCAAEDDHRRCTCRVEKRRHLEAQAEDGAALAKIVLEDESGRQ